jgi:hypothetical protein
VASARESPPAAASIIVRPNSVASVVRTELRRLPGPLLGIPAFLSIVFVRAPPYHRGRAARGNLRAAAHRPGRRRGHVVPPGGTIVAAVPLDDALNLGWKPARLVVNQTGVEFAH